MHRWNIATRLMTAGLLITLTIVAVPVATLAAGPSARPAGAACDLQPNSATRSDVQGATLLGRVKGMWERSPVWRVYWVEVIKEYEGDFKHVVKVGIRCNRQELREGKQYLLSSGKSTLEGGRIKHIAVNDDVAVGWQVYPERPIRLLPMGNPDGTREAPQYWKDPETVRQRR